jgi:hypothetical protein
MKQQFKFEPTPLIDLGLFCFKLDRAHWEARKLLSEKVMVGSTGGPWAAESTTREQIATLKETWKNDLCESAGRFVPSDPRGVGLQALVARTLGRYLSKEVRQIMGDGTDRLGAPVLDDAIRDCTPVRRDHEKE